MELDAQRDKDGGDDRNGAERGTDSEGDDKPNEKDQERADGFIFGHQRQQVLNQSFHAVRFF